MWQNRSNLSIKKKNLIFYEQEIETTNSVAQLMAATVAFAVVGVGCGCWLFLRPCGLLPPQLRARARRAFKTYSICLVAERFSR